jgi:hypothetical protein
MNRAHWELPWEGVGFGGTIIDEYPYLPRLMTDREEPTVELQLMTANDFNDLEGLWDALLSRDVQRIRSVYNSLDVEDRQSILAHINRMVNEPGWQKEQRISARAALEALTSDSKQV